MKPITVYVATFGESQKQYVGQTTQPLKKRCQENDRHRPRAPFEVMALATVENARQAAMLEKFWIKTFDSMAPNGLNRIYGGNGAHQYWRNAE